MLATAAGFFATFAGAQSLAIEVANLREDVRMLAQRVGELSLNVEHLQRENQSLRNQAESGNQAYATLSQMNSAIAELKRANNAALADQKRETISQVSQQIDQLAKQMQAAIDALSRGSTPSSAGKTLVFTDDFSKEAVAMHTVATGDTLSSIAKKYGASVRDIQNANKIADPTRIQVGQTLFIPKPKP
jgi:LysM repeat protein